MGEWKVIEFYLNVISTWVQFVQYSTEIILMFSILSVIAIQNFDKWEGYRWYIWAEQLYVPEVEAPDSITFLSFSAGELGKKLRINTQKSSKREDVEGKTHIFSIFI